MNPPRDPWLRMRPLGDEDRAIFIQAWVDGKAGALALADVQREVDARIVHWRSVLAPRALPEQPRSRNSNDAGLVAMLGLGLLSTMLNLRVGIILGVLLLAMLALAALFAFWRRHRSAIAVAWIANHCPSCRYDLSALRDQDVRGMALQRVGPRCCPECGAPWPLLPPPVPGNARRAQVEPPTEVGG